MSPDDDATAVTAAQVRAVIDAPIAAGQHKPGDPDVLIVFVPRQREVPPAGDDVARLSVLLADLPVHLLGRLRGDRVLYLPVAARTTGTTGRPPRHGARFVLGQSQTWPTPDQETITATSRYGTARARSWNHLHPKLTHRAGWSGYQGTLAVLGSTVIRLHVDHLPGEREARPVWLFSSSTDLDAAQVDECWQMFLRRFDLEHTFWMLEQTLGWRSPKIRTPRRGIAGRGWSSWPTPTCAWPAAWSRTPRVLGNPALGRTA